MEAPRYGETLFTRQDQRLMQILPAVNIWTLAPLLLVPQLGR